MSDTNITKSSEITSDTDSSTEISASSTASNSKRIRLTPEEKQAKLEEEIAKKQAQLEKLKARSNAKERKMRTHNLIKMGGAIYHVLGGEYQEGDEGKLIAFLEKQDSRGNYFSNAMGGSRKESKSPDVDKIIKENDGVYARVEKLEHQLEKSNQNEQK